VKRGRPPEAPFSVSTITCRNYAAAPRAPFNATASANAGEAYLTRRITRRRRVLLWPPQPDDSSIGVRGRPCRELQACRIMGHRREPRAGWKNGGEREARLFGEFWPEVESLAYARRPTCHPFRGRRAILRARSPGASGGRRFRGRGPGPSARIAFARRPPLPSGPLSRSRGSTPGASRR
jgi:hypothetical protein